MRKDISITLGETDRQRLEALVADRNTPRKRVWRARIVLLSAEGVGTNGVMAATGTAKTAVWRRQARFMEECVEGLLRDKTRPPGAAPVAICKLKTLKRQMGGRANLDLLRARLMPVA